ETGVSLVTGVEYDRVVRGDDEAGPRGQLREIASLDRAGGSVHDAEALADRPEAVERAARVRPAGTLDDHGHRPIGCVRCGALQGRREIALRRAVSAACSRREGCGQRENEQGQEAALARRVLAPVGAAASPPCAPEPARAGLSAGTASPQPTSLFRMHRPNLDPTYACAARTPITLKGDSG